MSGVCFVDVETTGLDPEWNPIWQVAVIIDDVEHLWHVQVPDGIVVVEENEDPPHQRPWVSRWVLDNTGYLSRSTEGLTPFASIERFAELTAGRHLVGAVPSFDEERMRRLYRLHIDEAAVDFPWHYHLIDVEAMAVGYLCARHRSIPPLPWDSNALSRALGVTPYEGEHRHSALWDARWARALYLKMVGPT